MSNLDGITAALVPIILKTDSAGASDGILELQRQSTLLKTGALQDAIFNSVNFSSIATDAKGVIQIFNVGAERMLGYTAAEVMNKITPADISDPQEVIARAEVLSLELGTPIKPGFEALVFKASRGIEDIYELTYLRKDGSRFPAIVSVTALRDAHKNIIGYLLIGTDNTMRKVAEEEHKRQVAERQAAELQHANEALEHSNIELQRFAYIASHDLQTPMRSIASFIELLQSTYASSLDAQANDWIRRTSQSIRHLQTLIRDLLEYSRVDAQARPFEHVSIRDVFDHAVSLLDVSVRESCAEVTCGELPVVMGERTQLVQLMLNFIANALKYRGKEPPRVCVSAEKKGDEWIFSVRDNGIGIEQKHHEKIFEIFQRLHDQKEYPGTEIGLAICRRVVHRHGGRIWVESKPGRGSIFYFTIAEETGIST